MKALIDVDGTEKLVLPVLPQLLNEYFRIMGDDGVPYAIQIVQKLSEAFATYSKADDDDEEASMAAAQCIETVCAVLQCASTRPDVYAEIEPHIVPVVATIFSGDGDYIEYLENGIDVLTYLTFYGEGISPRLWALFPALYCSFDKWAYD